MLPSQLCWSHYCFVLFIGMFRKDSFLFGSYDKIATNGNDSQTVLCSQRITHQNIEWADFCAGNSAAPFVLTKTSSPQKQVPLFGSLESPFSPIRIFIPCGAFASIPSFYLCPARKDSHRTSMGLSPPKAIKKSNKQILRCRKHSLLSGSICFQVNSALGDKFTWTHVLPIWCLPRLCKPEVSHGERPSP